MGPGGPFLCALFLLAPSPAASPEISQGRPGTGAVATVWGDDGAAAGAAAPRGAAPGPHAGASPGTPHHLRGTPRQLFRFRPGFPYERGKVGRHRGVGVGHGTRPPTFTPALPPRPSVAVGAPRANTSQPGVAQPGAVFLCSWPHDKTPCHPLPIDTEGA